VYKKSSSISNGSSSQKQHHQLWTSGNSPQLQRQGKAAKQKQFIDLPASIGKNFVNPMQPVTAQAP